MAKVALSAVYSCICAAFLCMIIGISTVIPWIWGKAALWCLTPMPVIVLAAGLYTEWADDFRTMKAKRGRGA